jgi:hypothetical protein
MGDTFKYDSALYYTLNNYGYSDDNIATIKEYLRTRVLPPELDTWGKKKLFTNKWHNDDWEIENNHLVYIPRNLIVIPESERNKILKDVYEDITTGVGQGITAFYERIRAKYLNIRRKDVGEFLKSQKPYQLTRPQNHIINKPILTTAPNERWGIDCISMTSYSSGNGNYKFILTVVDYYSRKVWLRRLKSQTAINVRNALINIVEETNTYPRIAQCDNGSEFHAETSEWFREHNIQYIKTLSYSPESNGLVEGKNKIVRKMLREIMIRNNNRNWKNNLRIVEQLMNTTVNTTTKRAPDDIWKQGHPLQGEVNQDVVARHKTRVVNAIKNNSTTEYKIEDYVRVKLGTLYSSVRKVIKSGDKKLIVVNYSPTIYRIHSILRKDRADRRVGDTVISYEKSRYTLNNMDGTPLQTQEKNDNPYAERQRKRFFASDMILVPQPEDDETYLSGFTIKDALRLNKMDKPNPIAVERAQSDPDR